jgi:hypothetical protein
VNRRTIFPCSCHSFHFLTFEWWPEEKWDDACAYIALGGEDWTSLRRRLRLAWHALFGNDCQSVYEAILEHDDIVKLRNELNEYLKDKPGNVAGMV